MTGTTIHPPAETPVDPSLLLSKSDLAGHLRCSERQVDKLRNELPPAIYLGSTPRWLRSEIIEWLKKRGRA